MKFSFSPVAHPLKSGIQAVQNITTILGKQFSTAKAFKMEKINGWQSIFKFYHVNVTLELRLTAVHLLSHLSPVNALVH